VKPKPKFFENETIECSFSVKNISNRTGDEVAQVYIKYPGKGLPQKELRNFSRITIKRGTPANVKVSFSVSDLEKWDEKSEKTLIPKGIYTLFVGGNSADERILAKFEIK
jgi:beta-glucosidase